MAEWTWARFRGSSQPEAILLKLMAKNKVKRGCWISTIPKPPSNCLTTLTSSMIRKSKKRPARYIDMARDPKVLASMPRPRLEGSRVRFESSRRTVKVLYDLGVNILVGTDSTGAPHRMFYGWDLHREMALLVEAGMKPMDVIVAASRKAAEYLGQEKELGTIEPGKKAVLIILSPESSGKYSQHTKDRTGNLRRQNHRPREYSHVGSVQGRPGCHRQSNR